MIRGVLFDAGGVLTRPVGGRWNPRYDFESIVGRHCPGVREDRFAPAIAAGQRFLDESPTTANRTDYHRVMLTVLGIGDPSAELLHELETPAAGPVVELYPEVRRVLEELRRRGIRMSVVSDNWGGTEVAFAALGIHDYFAGYAISAVLGCRKPDPRMYAEGSRLLGLTAPECLFVDDDPDLVAAARDLGYHGLHLDRDGAPGAATSLDEVLVTLS
jgi:HAD superfamily hydrolase (TIGR01509 family)